VIGGSTWLNKNEKPDLGDALVPNPQNWSRQGGTRKHTKQQTKHTHKQKTNNKKQKQTNKSTKPKQTKL
jgi:hypothetical protein